ncbi:MAG: transcription-repair coupling factor [Peptococcaceae bacterium]|nr:transcription-repair coupling factor [Peptococcaceae bacterium]
MGNIYDFLNKAWGIEEVQAQLNQPGACVLTQQLKESQKSAYVVALLRRRKTGGCILTYSEEQALRWVNDLKTLAPEEEVLYIPATEWLPFEMLGRSREITAQRLSALHRLVENPRAVLVAPVLAVERRLFSPERWRSSCLRLQTGQQVDMRDILQTLTASGYERVDIVESLGQFALRGGILDIAPLAASPARLEFFDEEIDSIRTFSLENQKSITVLDRMEAAPAQEYSLSREELQQLKWEIRSQGRSAVSRLRRVDQTSAAERLTARLEQIEQRLELGVLDENIYPYLSLTAQPLVSIYDYLNEHAMIVLDEPLRLKEQVDFQETERAEEFVRQLEHGEAFVHPQDQFMHYADIVSTGRRPLLLMSALLYQIPGVRLSRVYAPDARSISETMGKTGVLAEQIKLKLQKGGIVALFAGDQEHSLRLVQGLKDSGIQAANVALTDPVQSGGVYIYACALDRGFELPQISLTLFAEAEIYRRERKKTPSPPKTESKSSAILKVSEIKADDYVVHVYHGVGRFTGIERLVVGGSEKDYFAIQYAGNDKLFVPLDQLHLVQKYLGTGGTALPKLNKLGGNEWNKVKGKACSAVKELAFDLVKLYASREETPGFAYSPDNVWQREFEEKFPYEETPDQLQCILEVKKDMMKPQPMDRLICGDVGYGKTEVALRAAFKAVMDSKQVAVLVPTTILAQQHYNTFVERFSGYPVKVEMLSRFRQAKEQKEILTALQDGSLDIVIGTHRLLSNQVKFKDLGLIIVDEEQRFGVAHKEKLKTLKTTVDALTLTATPIPRTLHMSLTGVRDMSIIETPPEDRYPVQTYISEFRLELVRDAIRRELQRSGQVFYVHNRVEDIDRLPGFLRELVPEARVAIAHGQMSEIELEKEMIAFLDHEIDVLISTTIIESGLDMPNVNTLIIEDADRLGLAQLYQLRGRVGRSNRKAFAYFLYQTQKVLSEVAEQRLLAIREFTDFGSGFRIAMRDLEIRGAGNLVGAQQHGHLAAVGFDLYCRLLKEAVLELRGQKVEESVEPSIELQIDAYLPDHYIGDRQSKIAVYQRIVTVNDERSLSDMTDELIDRFGSLPREVENLLKIMRIKWQAKALWIEQIQQNAQGIVLHFAADPGLSGEQLILIAGQAPYPLAFGVDAQGKLESKIRLRVTAQEQVLKAVNQVLEVFAAVRQGNSGASNIC